MNVLSGAALQTLLVSIACFVTAAAAAPPPNADPKMAPFFEGLHRKDVGGNFSSCCGSADCRPVESRGPDRSPSHRWEVFIDKQTFNRTAPDDWVVVPPWMVDDASTDLPRPAKAIACWYGAVELYHKPGQKLPGNGHLLCFKTPLPEI